MNDEFTRRLAAYKEVLTRLEQEAQSDYDKAVMALSGGALGVTFSFWKELSGRAAPVHSGFLVVAWICWGLSVTSVLFSFYTSQRALRHAISQVEERTIYLYRPGGWFGRITTSLNAFGGILFFLGLLLTCIFAYQNFTKL
jgi:hypothetical protein